MSGIEVSVISGRSGVDRANRNTMNEAERLKEQLMTLPDIAVKAAIRSVYPTIVRETVQDSGKAAYNWWIGAGKAMAGKRFYVDDVVGPIGFPGEKRTKGTSAIGLSVPSPELIIQLKIAYMEKFIGSTSFNSLKGATIYNQTPVKNEATFKGSYEGNAKIRIAVAKAMVTAQDAVDQAMREFT